MLNQNLIKVVFIFLSLFQIYSSQYLKCELALQQNESQTGLSMKQCINEIESKKDTLNTLSISHKQQELPENQDSIHIENIKELAQSLQGCPQLQNLRITLDNPLFYITFQDLLYFKQYFQQQTQLYELSLNFNNQNLVPILGYENLLELFFNSKNYEKLGYLELQFYGTPLLFSDYGLLFKHITKLHRLIINFGGQQNTKNPVQFTPNTFKNIQDIDELIIMFSNSKEIYFRNLFEALSAYFGDSFMDVKNISVLSIDLSGNEISGIYKEKLNFGIKSQGLTKIHFNFNDCVIQENFLKDFDNMFMHIRNLKNLNDFIIDLNNVRQEKVVKAMVESLSNNGDINFLQSLTINNQENYYLNVILNLSQSIAKMRGLKKLELNLKVQNENFCPFQNGIEEMLENLSYIEHLTIKQSLYKCARDVKYEQNYQTYYSAIKNLKQGIKSLEIEIILDSQFADIFEYHKNLKNMNLVVYNYVYAGSKDEQLLLINQNNLEVLQLEWNFLVKGGYQFKREYPKITQNDNFYKSMEKLIPDQIGNDMKGFQFQMIFLDIFQEQFDISFYKNIISDKKYFYGLILRIKNVYPVDWDLDFLGTSFQDAEFLVNFILEISDQENSKLNLKIKNVDFLNTMLQKNQRIENVQIKIQQQNQVNFKPLQKLFQEQILMENLVLQLNNGDFNEPLYLAFNYNNKIKGLQLFLMNNQSKDMQILNSLLKPLYNSVTSFYLSDNNDKVDQSKVYNLQKLKEQKLRFYINSKQEMKLQECKNFDSPCEDCTQEQGYCTSCLYNFYGGSCNKCKSQYYLDNQIDKCASCVLYDEKILSFCYECKEDQCLTCDLGYEIQDESKYCTKIQEEDDDNYGLIIGLSIGGGILLIIIAVVSYYLKQKKKYQSQQESSEQQQELLSQN